MATPIVADLDMDGRADVMFPIPGHGKGFEDDFTPAFWKEFHWRIDSTTGNGTFVAVESTDDVEKADPLTPYPNCAIADDLDCPQPPPPLQIADLNGDGLP